jgi:hypothetical protein
MNSAPESGEAFRRARLIAGAGRFSRGAIGGQGGSIVARRPLRKPSDGAWKGPARARYCKQWNRDGEQQLGR